MVWSQCWSKRQTTKLVFLGQTRNFVVFLFQNFSDLLLWDITLCANCKPFALMFYIYGRLQGFYRLSVQKQFVIVCTSTENPFKMNGVAVLRRWFSPKIIVYNYFNKHLVKSEREQDRSETGYKTEVETWFVRQVFKGL